MQIRHNLEEKIVMRRFDPLHYPSNKDASCVLHICSYFEDYGERNLLALKECVVSLGRLKNDKSIDIVISVNGFVDYAPAYNYLEELRSNTRIIVFQRPNFGHQWGGLYDVWMKYKGTNCGSFATIEQDCYFIEKDWFEVLRRDLKSYGYVGMASRVLNTINPYKYEEFSIPDNTWRNDKNEAIKIGEKDTEHSRGGFYLCSRELLQKMDEVYGCFTFALGHHHYYDGIVQGEVAFAHKTKALGFKWRMAEGIIGMYV